jgi:hypothetical protein
MRKLKELKGIHGIFVDSITDLDSKIQQQLKKIKLEYQQNVSEEKVRLLLTICNGEGLDFDKIKNKYLKSKELSYISKEETFKENEIEEEELLDKIEINGKQFYYEAKEKGLVYDLNSKSVGVFKNGKVFLN